MGTGGQVLYMIVLLCLDAGIEVAMSTNETGAVHVAIYPQHVVM